MFVYRFEYKSNGRGIYRGSALPHIDKLYLILEKYRDKQQNIYGIDVHPTFCKQFKVGELFGFDSDTKFMRWFPEKLLKKIIKNKKKDLKFTIYRVAKKYIKSDEVQCVFDSKSPRTKKIISCNMGCLLIKL